MNSGQIKNRIKITAAIIYASIGIAYAALSNPKNPEDMAMHKLRRDEEEQVIQLQKQNISNDKIYDNISALSGAREKMQKLDIIIEDIERIDISKAKTEVEKKYILDSIRSHINILENTLKELHDLKQRITIFKTSEIDQIILDVVETLNKLQDSKKELMERSNQYV